MFYNVRIVCIVLQCSTMIYIVSFIITREFIHTVVHLLGLIADCSGYLIFGMLSYIYDITKIDFRWVVLALSVSFLSRYTAIASIIDWFFSKRSFIHNHNQSYLLYFICQGTVTLSIIIRSQSELLDTSNVENMLRTVLFMIFFSVMQIIIIANPLINRRSPHLQSGLSRAHSTSPFVSDLREDLEGDTEEGESLVEDYPKDTKTSTIKTKLSYKTDRLFPYLVKIDTSTTSL